MNEEIAIDQTIHVLYSKECESQIKQAIALHYPSDQVDAIWYSKYENCLSLNNIKLL